MQTLIPTEFTVYKKYIIICYELHISGIFVLPQVRRFIMSPIKDPKLELIIVMFIVPFIVNVSLYHWFSIDCTGGQQRSGKSIKFRGG